MLQWMSVAVCMLVLLAPGEPPQSEPEESEQEAAESQPAVPPSSLRKPSQADILRDLLRQQRPQPIPAQSAGSADEREIGDADERGRHRRTQLLEGSFLVERPGRLVHEGGQAKFVFIPEGDDGTARTLELLPNQLLETMEREAEAGFTEFIISAEVTAYRGSNYLLLRKVLRRVGHGNISP